MLPPDSTDELASVGASADLMPAFERQAALARVLAQIQVSEAQDEAPAIGRYTFVRRLGAGGMGIVYLVRDPELDRLVALKLLHPNLARGASAAAIERRMRREARAMARLDHENVVRVHEVGEHEGRSYLAMEYVEGTTLTRWLEGKHDWREIVGVFLAAGEGLAAAHAAGLAHCDFKPDNVLIGDNGAIKVSDFGLVRAHELATTEHDVPSATSCGSSGLTTVSTGLVGTPAFMAPEQFDGHRGDPRSDQFSYCVALYTALHGTPPFAGETLAELQASISEGLDARSASGPKVPAALDRAIVRGLAVDPHARWPSMLALLAELRRALKARARRRRALALTAVALAGVAVAGAKLQERLEREQQLAACVADGEALAEFWTADTQAGLREQVLASGKDYANQTVERLLPALDDYAQAWARARTDACLDTRVRGEWDEDIYARSRSCLDARRMNFEDLVTMLSRAGTPMHEAVTAAFALPQIAQCRDQAALASLPASGPDREQLEPVQRSISQVQTLRRTGQIEAALEAIPSARASAKALAWAPSIAESLTEEAQLLLDTGEPARAEEVFEAAYFVAAKAQAHEFALASAIALVDTLAELPGRFEDGLRWAEHAEVLLATHDLGELATLRAVLINNLGVLYLNHGDYEQARAHHEQALELFEVQYGPDHPAVANPLHMLAELDMRMADFQAARSRVLRERTILARALGPDHPELAVPEISLGRLDLETGAPDFGVAHYQRALELMERGYGSNSPNTAIALAGLAMAERARGNYDVTIAHFERALAIQEQTLGPDNPKLVPTLHGLGAALELSHDYAGATSALERALAIQERSSDPNQMSMANTLNSLAILRQRDGKYAEAEAFGEQAMDIAVRSLGPEHPMVGYLFATLAEIHQDAGDLDEAVDAYEQSLEVLRASIGPDHPDLGYALTGLSEIALAQGRHADAIEQGERAVQVRETAQVADEFLASSRLALARALASAPAEQGGDRARARLLAEQARTGFARGPGMEEELAAVDAVLAELEQR